MRHVITLLVENEFGVLTRIAGLFSGRGFNIESLCVAETLDPTVSTMTIVTRGDDQIIEQVLKQLNKLISVIKVVDLIEKDFVEREMVLVKVSATPETREEILRVVDIFRGKVIDVGAKTYTIEVTGDEKKINALLALLKPLGIKELVRTGRVAMIRGSKITTEPGNLDHRTTHCDPSVAARDPRFFIITGKEQEMKIYYDKDANLNHLKGKKIAIIGYGSQGHAQAQNLRDSGLNVIVSEMKGTENYQFALRDGFKPITASEASKQADLIQILTQDHVQAKLYEKDVKPHLQKGKNPLVLPWVQYSLRPDRPSQRDRCGDDRPERSWPSGAKRISKGSRRPIAWWLSIRIFQRRPSRPPWPMPKASAPLEPV